MSFSLSKALTYVTPAPISALKTVYDYTYIKDKSQPSYNAFNNAKYTLLNTAIAVTAFLLSAKLKSKLGSHFNDAVTVGSIFLSGALAEIIFARALVASFRGGLNAISNKNPTAL